MGVTMIEKNEKTRHSYAVLALMAMLVAGLLFANYLVKTRSVINLSDPIILPQVGLKIAMPSGSGWVHDSQWRAGNNAFVLLGALNPDSTKPLVQVVATLKPTPRDLKPEDIFFQKAAEIKAGKFEPRQLNLNGLTAYSVMLRSQTSPYAFAFSIITLTDKLQLELEILETTGDEIFADQLLDKILHSIEFAKDNEPNTLGEK